MKFVSPKVWLVGLPCVWSFALHHSRSTGAAAISFSKCLDDPGSCASGVEQMVETASTITQEVHHELNATRKRFVNIIQEFVGCNTLMSQASSYRSSFAAKVRSHMQCRRQQKADRDMTMMCKVVLSAAGTNRTLLCKREGRTRVTTDLVRLCRAADLVCGWKTWPSFSTSMGCNVGQPGQAWQWFKYIGVTGGGHADIGSGTNCGPYKLAPCACHVGRSIEYPACPSYEHPLRQSPLGASRRTRRRTVMTSRRPATTMS